MTILVQGEQKIVYDLGDRVRSVARPGHPINGYNCVALQISHRLFPENFPLVHEWAAGEHPDGFMIVQRIPTTPEYEARVRCHYHSWAYGKDYESGIDYRLGKKHEAWIKQESVQIVADDILRAGIRIAVNPVNVIQNAGTGHPVFLEFGVDDMYQELPPFVSAAVEKYIHDNEGHNKDELLEMLKRYVLLRKEEYHPIPTADILMFID
ncbi:MAG: hypothetical protein ABIJ08_01325 [Nanoarchaeota archaeon]